MKLALMNGQTLVNAFVKLPGLVVGGVTGVSAVAQGIVCGL